MQFFVIQVKSKKKSQHVRRPLSELCKHVFNVQNAEIEDIWAFFSVLGGLAFDIASQKSDEQKKFKSTSLAKMLAGLRKFFREPHVCHL